MRIPAGLSTQRGASTRETDVDACPEMILCQMIATLNRALGFFYQNTLERA